MSLHGKDSQEKRKDVEEAWQKEDAEDVIILKSKGNILPWFAQTFPDTGVILVCQSPSKVSYQQELQAF